MLGMPSYIHKDRGASFTSRKLSSFFQRCGISCSGTPMYPEMSSSSSWQFISLLFSQHKKLNERIKTTSEKGMQVTKPIDVKHTQIF